MQIFVEGIQSGVFDISEFIERCENGFRDRRST